MTSRRADRPAALILDSGGVSRLAERSRQTLALIEEFRRAGLWPPVVPTVVLVESLTGDPGRDARVNALLKTCDLVDELPVRQARRAAWLRAAARRGSAVDAVTVATAEPEGTVLTSDPGDPQALASNAARVRIERV